MPDNEELPEGVDLAEAIEALRSQLNEAMEKSPETGLRFRPGPVELTVQAALTKNVVGKAGIRWWLIEAGGEASRQSAITQTLKISLQPVQVNPRGEVVDALISGTDAPPEDTPDRPRQATGGPE
ncbi:trypco2 family protein [Arthrobacter sp. BE255]|uniref:trypco2 family protein n=1 Tax=Arthrobacter sp. BE255 TaxID=2817721 RepID=UPI002866E477|nr:trypco2 family protein [Arthrobacter sp. BE255]MDR7161736.1 hypothetical protein [Arthrobacter sp. BE255]